MRGVLLSSEVITYKGVRWWAEGGLIHREDVGTGEYKSITTKDMLLRLNAISDMHGNSIRKGIIPHPSEFHADQRWIAEMAELVAAARRQGCPDDPRHRAQLLDNIKTKRNSRMVVPTPATSMG